MNIVVFPPTDEQMAAYRRRQNFRSKIEDAAAVLAQKNLEAAALKVEAVPAEPDPPAPCPECVALKAVLAKMRPVKPEPGNQAYPPVKAVLAVVASYYNVTRRDICSARRTYNVVLPRQVAMYLAKELTPFSLPLLGRHFGRRDHTTILHGIRKIAAMVRADAQFALEVVSLRMMLETGEAD